MKKLNFVDTILNLTLLDAKSYSTLTIIVFHFTLFQYYFCFAYFILISNGWIGINLDWLIREKCNTGNLMGSYFVTLRRQSSLQATSVNPAILFRIKLRRFSYSFYLERLHARASHMHAVKKSFLDMYP